jgi:tetratricopeptide (TPR) repeat protein
MANTIRFKQIGVIAAIVLLIGFLFSRDIKGLVKPKDENKGGRPAANGQMTSAPAPQEISLAEVSATAKNAISAGLSAEITDLEHKFSASSDEDKLQNAKLLAQKWDDVEQAIPGALYLEIVAQQEETLKNWLNAGDHFLKAYDNTRDSLLVSALLQKANNAYSNALKIDSASNDAKTGMGITIVNGMGMPMQGIAMLLDVVKKDPKNLKANMSLGTFAIKSGQFDKAISRFNDIIAIQPSPDAYFYLATAYENLGKNKEAVDAYLKSKKLAANPTLSKFIDEKVSALNSKN